MPNRTLSDSDVQEICAALQGLKGRASSAVVKRYAEFFGVSPAAIYARCKHVRPARQERSDKGKRAADLMTDPKLKLAAELVVKHNLKPAYALRVVDPTQPDAVSPVSEGTFKRYCREQGISRAQNQNSIRPYRKWEASAPGELGQFDITGLKTRWLDIKTRRILKIFVDDKNHANRNPHLVRLWSMCYKDKYSRLMYQRFIAVDKPVAADVIQFLLRCFRALGVPLSLYTDNDPVIKNRLMDRAAAILNKAFESTGGFKQVFHAPNNARATGLVEQAHRWVEEFSRYVGVKYSAPTMEQLDIFSEDLCAQFNSTPNRATGVRPDLRFLDGHNVKRLAPDETLDSAFKAREFERRIRPTVTFEYDGVDYQLPRDDKYPFLEWATMGVKATFLWPPDESFYLVTARGYDEFTVDRVAAVADAAGEFKALHETRGAQNRKALRASAAGRRKALVAEGKELLVPGFDLHHEPDNVDMFRRAAVAADTDALRELPGAEAVLGRQIAKWPAITMLMDEEVFTRPIAIEERAWIDALYGTRETIDETELRRALETRAAEAATNVVSLMERTA